MLTNKHCHRNFLLVVALLALASISLGSGKVAMAQQNLPSTGNPQNNIGGGLQPTGSGLQPTAASTVLGTNTNQYNPESTSQLKVDTNYAPSVQLTNAKDRLTETGQTSPQTTKLLPWLFWGGGIIIGLALIFRFVKKSSGSSGGNIFTS